MKIKKSKDKRDDFTFPIVNFPKFKRLTICLNSSIVYGSLLPGRSNLGLIVQLMSPPRNIGVLDSRKGQKKNE